MTIQDRRARERSAQRRLIVTAARSLAEREGWDTVTTRRLSSEIDYSQPVIYKHFASLDELSEAIALEGFDELAEALAAARSGTAAQDAAGAVARAYTAFAAASPSLYDAMFVRSTRLAFGTDDAPSPLSAAYSELRAAVSAIAGERDAETLAEVFWAALHGLVMLGRGDRIRPEHDADRVELLIARFSAR